MLTVYTSLPQLSLWRVADKSATQATNSTDLALAKLQLVYLKIWPNAATETLKKQVKLCIYGSFFCWTDKLNQLSQRNLKSSFGLDALGCFSSFIIQGTAYECKTCTYNQTTLLFPSSITNFVNPGLLAAHTTCASFSVVFKIFFICMDAESSNFHYLLY